MIVVCTHVHNVFQHSFLRPPPIFEKMIVPFPSLVSHYSEHNNGHYRSHHHYRNQRHHPGQQFAVWLILRTCTAVAIDFVITNEGCNTWITEAFINFLSAVFPLITSLAFAGIVSIETVCSVSVVAWINSCGY